MAIAWVSEIRNNHPTAALSVRLDDGRHPMVNGVTYDRDQWLDVGPRRGQDDPSIVRPENMAVPWSYGGANKMLLRVKSIGGQNTVSAEIRGTDAWDYIVFRDIELTELKSLEAGSLGDAPGVNHSWWSVCLHDNGIIEWHLMDRQGARRDDIVNALGKAGSFFIQILPDLIKMETEMAKLATTIIAA